MPRWVMKIKVNESWITDIVFIQNGYAYIDHLFWNAEKQQADHKSEYIGKYDGKDFRPNKNFHCLNAEYDPSLTYSKIGSVPTDVCLRQIHGATYLLDKIAEKTGIASDFGKCYCSLVPQILSIAYYPVIEEGLPLYRFTKWAVPTGIFMPKNITLQRSSELSKLITEESKIDYFKYQAKRHSCDEYLAFGTTSISSYSTLIKQAKYGKDKEGDYLPQ